MLPGVGPKRAEVLARLGIKTIEGLLRHYPLRYEDRRRPLSVGELADGEAALVRVRVRRVIRAPVAIRSGAAPKVPMKVICGDESGDMTLLYFNARWMSGVFREDTEYWVYGMVRRDLSGVSMAHPEIEPITEGLILEEDSSGVGTGIMPVYPLTEGVSQKYLRRLVRAAIPAASAIEEYLPETITSKRKLAPLGFALSNIHFPADEHTLNAARYRLIYEEVFLMQLRLLYARGLGETQGTSPFV